MYDVLVILTDRNRKVYNYLKKFPTLEEAELWLTNHRQSYPASTWEIRRQGFLVSSYSPTSEPK